MMNSKSFRSIPVPALLAFCLLAAGFAPMAMADEFANAQRLLTHSMQVISNSPSALKDILHPASSGVALEGCEDASKPGWGLVCPPPGPVSTSQEKVHTVVEYSSFEAALGTKLKELAKYSSKNSGFVNIVWQTTSIPDHAHKQDCSGNNCQSRYISFADMVHFAWAFGQETKFDVDAPVTAAAAKDFGSPSVQADFRKKKFVGGYIGPIRYCGYKEHPGDTSCGIKRTTCGPTTGGSTGGSTGEGTGGSTGEGTGDGTGDDRGTTVDPAQNGFGSSSGDWWESVAAGQDEECPCEEPTAPDAESTGGG